MVVAFSSVLRQTARTFVEKHPVFVVSVISLPVTLPLGHFYLSWRAKRMSIKPIDSRLKEGSKPPILKESSFVERPDLVETITQRFLVKCRFDLDFDLCYTKSFGVIIGPTGTGKTELVRQVCNKDASGALYHEVKDADYLGRELAKTCGLPLKPAGIMGLIISSVSDHYRHYYKLPNDGQGSAAIQFVLDELEARSAEFLKKEGMVPCLFIDGIDLLAKHDKDSFINLVRRAKTMADSLRIVFVSSEGHVMPLLDSDSSSSRAAWVEEVLDLPDEDAKKYLVEIHKMPEDLAEEVVSIIGGRLIHLENAVEYHVFYKTRGYSKEEQLEEMKTRLYSKYVMRPLLQLEYSNSVPKIVKVILSDGQAHPKFLLKEVFDNDVTTMTDTLAHLMQCNLLRYTANGKVTLHSKLIKEAVMEENNQ